MFKWGKRSLANLSSCDTRLNRIATRVLNLGIIDIACIEGHRSIDRQQKLFHAGKSKIDGINKKGKHNYSPSLAGDFVPLVNGVVDWDNKLAFHIMAGLFFAIAAEEGVKLRWGGDWDGDFSNKDQSFHDLPHFEIVE